MIAVFKEDGKVCGYSAIKKFDTWYNFFMQKTNPAYEKYEINAALVYGVLEYYEDQIKAGKYICDGERNISHDTKFQDYLEKYFEFRKAYCHLHVTYDPKLKWIIKALYPFRNTLRKFDKKDIVHKVNSVLMMEDLMRNGKAVQE